MDAVRDSQQLDSKTITQSSQSFLQLQDWMHNNISARDQPERKIFLFDGPSKNSLLKLIHLVQSEGNLP